jgi:hypothetical protein
LNGDSFDLRLAGILRPDFSVDQDEVGRTLRAEKREGRETKQKNRKKSHKPI